MNKFINVILFAAGAAIGSAVTYKLVKTKYELIADEEIASVREMYAARYDELENDLDALKEVSRVTGEYAALAARYSTPVPEEKKEDDIMTDEPYVIAPDECGDFDDYEVISLTYFADGVLADEYDEIVEDADDIVGDDFETHFGEYEEDSIYIRNDARKCDYEILRDLRNYTDVVGPTEE